jgi:triosephosphate isomerase
MPRREIFAGNWKMYKSRQEALDLVIALKAECGSIGTREVAVFPPAVWAHDVALLCKGSKIDVGIQNMYFENEGAFTGEISPLMVKDTGCRYVLIGHSERRHVFKETDAQINKKVLAALNHGIEPMLCIGELIDEREAGETEKVLARQIKEGLSGVSKSAISKVVVAYEPVWAIGTGKVATPEMADDAHLYIRNLIKNIYGDEAADFLPVLYGGSVKPDNIEGLYQKKNIDGVLVGGASLKADSFLSIVRVK